MKAKQNYQLTDEEQQTIQRAMRHDKRPEVRRKAQAIHLLHQGHLVTEVARMVAVTRQTIYVWHYAWLAGGGAWP
jgi:transposase